MINDRSKDGKTRTGLIIFVILLATTFLMTGLFQKESSVLGNNQKFAITDPDNATIVKYELYRVRKGDTLTAISVREKIHLSVLMYFNPEIEDEDLIITGRYIKIPKVIEKNIEIMEYPGEQIDQDNKSAEKVGVIDPVDEATKLFKASASLSDFSKRLWQRIKLDRGRVKFNKEAFNDPFAMVIFMLLIVLGFGLILSLVKAKRKNKSCIVESDVKKTSGDEKIDCPYCKQLPYDFHPTRKHFDRHLDRHTKDKTKTHFICRFCHKLIHSSGLKGHLLTHHSEWIVSNQIELTTKK